MPDRLVIIGGGAVGFSTALYAQSHDLDVTVVERTHPGAGASGHNGGIFSLGNCLPTSTPDVLLGLPRMLADPLSPLAIRWAYLPKLAPWLTRFVLSGRPSRIEEISIVLAQMLERAVDAYEPILPPGSIVPSPGHLIGFASPKAFVSAASSLELRRRRGIAARVLEPDDITDLDPSLQGKFVGGMLIEGAPFVLDPAATVTLLAQRFQEQGGTIVQDEVVGFEISDRSVRTVRGRRDQVPANHVVVAAGAWSKSLAAALGARVPLDTERGYGIHLPTPGVSLRIPLIYADHHIALTPAGDGELRIVGTDELAGIDAPPDPRRIDKLIEATRTIFPLLDSSGSEGWLSFRPSMPDSLPVIDRAPAADNAYLAFGHGHIGFTTAALTGRLVSSMIIGAPPEFDLSPLRAGRFALRRGACLWEIIP